MNPTPKTDTEILDQILKSLRIGADENLGNIGMNSTICQLSIDFIESARTYGRLLSTPSNVVFEAMTDAEWTALLARVRLEFVPRTDFDQLREELRQQARRLATVADPFGDAP